MYNILVSYNGIGVIIDYVLMDLIRSISTLIIRSAHIIFSYMIKHIKALSIRCDRHVQQKGC